jgi:sulfite reductase beta subunit-like hemoprotein
MDIEFGKIAWQSYICLPQPFDERFDIVACIGWTTCKIANACIKQTMQHVKGGF